MLHADQKSNFAASDRKFAAHAVSCRSVGVSAC